MSNLITIISLLFRFPDYFVSFWEHATVLEMPETENGYFVFLLFLFLWDATNDHENWALRLRSRLFVQTGEWITTDAHRMRSALFVYVRSPRDAFFISTHTFFTRILYILYFAMNVARLTRDCEFLLICALSLVFNCVSISLHLSFTNTVTMTIVFERIALNRPVRKVQRTWKVNGNIVHV